MPDVFTATVPQSLSRRLILALRGWRYEAGAWTWHGLLSIDEETLDQMTDGAFAAFVTQWSTSAVSAL